MAGNLIVSALELIDWWFEQIGVGAVNRSLPEGGRHIFSQQGLLQ